MKFLLCFFDILLHVLCNGSETYNVIFERFCHLCSTEVSNQKNLMFQTLIHGNGVQYLFLAKRVPGNLVQ